MIAKLLISVLFLIFIFLPNSVLAAGNDSCPSVYGVNCPTGNLSIDKKVKNPQTGELVDFLSSSSTSFLPGQDVFFRIEVKNTGSAALSNISITDKLPDFIDFVQGPGNYDQNTRTVSWTIDNLNAGDSRFFDIKAKVRQSKSLPDMGIACVTNWTQAQKDNMVAQDTASFCIQTKILGTTSELPKTGVENSDVVLVGSLMALGGSMLIYLTKKLKYS